MRSLLPITRYYIYNIDCTKTGDTSRTHSMHGEKKSDEFSPESMEGRGHFVDQI